MKYKNQALLLLIVFLGLFLRVYGLGVNPVSTYWDETAMAYDAWVVSETGRDMHGNNWWQAIYPSYGDYKLPLYIWMASLLTYFFGESVFVFRLVSALAGASLIVVMYFLAKEMFKSKKAGLATAFIAAILPWSIHFSRSGFESNLGMLMVTISVLFMYRSLKKPYYIILSACFGALGVYGYYSVRFVYPMLMGVFWVINFKSLTKKHLLSIFVAILLFFGLILPILLSPHYQATNQFRLSTGSLLNTNNHIIEQNVNRELAGNTHISRVIYHRHWFLIKRFATNTASHLQLPFLFFWGDSNLRHGTQEVGLGVVMMMVLFFGGWYAAFKLNAKNGLFLLLTWLICLIPASIPLETPHALRSLNALPVMALIIGIGLFYWSSRLNKLAGKIFLAVSIIGLIWSLSLYWHDYWHHYPSRSASDWQYGYSQLAEYIYTIEEDYDQIYISNIDDRMNLYFLLTNQVDPEIARLNSLNYQIKDFGKYHFGNFLVDEIKTDSIKVLFISDEEFFEGNDELVKLKELNDINGRPQFIVATNYD